MYFRLKVLLLSFLFYLSVGFSIYAAGSAEEANARTRDLNTLTMATGAELTTLFPLNMDSQNLIVTRLCYEQLVDYVDGEIKPWLATSWEISEDGKRLIFHLREDVLYHDGTVFNAEAVKADFEFASANPNFRSITSVHRLKSVDIIDEFTVAFNYDQPYFAYLSEFTYREVMVCVSPKMIEEGNFQTMKGVVGTGPYVYSELKEGEYVRFVKNESYWGEEPVYDEIIVKYIPENSARLLALKNGEIDMIYGNGLVSWDDYNQAINFSNVKGLVSPVVSRSSTVVLNAANPMLSDIRVREAIAHGIDKAGLCQGLTLGHETPADTLYPRGNWFTDVELGTIRRYDPEESARLLEEAGWRLNEATGIREKDGTPLRFKFTYNSGETMNKMVVTTIKSHLAQVGIDACTEGQDMMTWWKEGVSGNYGMILWETEQNTLPQKYFKNIPTSSPHTPSIAAIEDSAEFVDSVLEMQTIDDKERVREIFSFLLSFNNDHVIDLPIRYLREPVLFNKERIRDYSFTDTPMIFEIDNLKRAQ